MSAKLDSQIPSGDLEGKWEKYKFDSKLINPANRRKYRVLVVGSGLAGSAAAATLAEQGYQVKVITIHDSPRRAPQYCCAGRNQCCQKLPLRWRQCLPFVLRHDQGRGLPLSRG